MESNEKMGCCKKAKDSSSETEKKNEIKACVHGPEEYQQPTFDYVDFMEFNRLQALLAQVQRLKEVNSNGDDLKEPSEEVVKKKFTDMYGPVDFELPEMKTMLEQVKNVLMEQAEGMDSEAILTQLWEKGINVCRPEDAEEQLKKLISQKFGAKQEHYTTFNPREAAGEWFVLPRGDPEDVRWRNFEQVPSKGAVLEKMPNMKEETQKKPMEPVSQELKGTLMQKNQPLTNLHLYDPKFEYCFQQPFRIFQENTHDLSEIPRMTSFMILEHLNRFPLGISPNFFWTSFYNFYRRSPDVDKMTPDSLLRHHPAEIWFFKDNGSAPPSLRLPELMFPRFLENVVDPETILKRIWHSINCLIGMRSVEESFVIADDLFGAMEDIYSIQFHPEDWNFGTAEFIKFCNKKFKASYLTTQKNLVVQDGLFNTVEYVLIQSNYLKRKVEELHSPMKPSPTVYMARLDVVDAVSNHCLQSVFDCELISVADPLQMFVIQLSLRKKRDDFMKMLQTHTDVRRSLNGKPIVPYKVTVEMYMLARIYKEETGAWYRVRVLDVSEDKQIFHVYAIDHGFFREVPFQCLSYLPRGEVAKELAYAIPVKLNYPGRLGVEQKAKKSEKWGRGLTRLIRDTTDGNCLRVQFMKGEFNKRLGCMEWTVTCNLIKRNPVDHNNLHPELTGLISQRFYEVVRERKKQRKVKPTVEEDTADEADVEWDSEEEAIVQMQNFVIPDKITEEVAAKNTDAEEKTVSDETTEEKGKDEVLTKDNGSRLNVVYVPEDEYSLSDPFD